MPLAKYALLPVEPGTPYLQYAACLEKLNRVEGHVDDFSAERQKEAGRQCALRMNGISRTTVSGVVDTDANVILFARAGNHRLRGFMQTHCHLFFGTHHDTTQGVGVDINNLDIHEFTDHVRRAFEIHHAVTLGTASQLHHAFTRRSFHQNSLHGTERGAAETYHLLRNTVLQNL